MIAAVICPAIIVGLVAASPPGHAQAAPTRSAPTGPLSAAAAAAQAHDTGQPVEVTAETTETSQVMANPDGTFTLSSYRQAVRAMHDGAWVPIDTSLHTNSDGTLSPAATTEQVAFSGGGTGPLATVTDGDRTLAFAWPAALPTPTVAGGTATYPGVLPGVDLTVTAGPDNFNEVLVVHDATAAANPALTQLHLAVTATGLDLTKDDDGGLTATDTAGTEVFHSTAPIMWDSHVNPEVGPTPTIQHVGSGQVNALGLAMPDADGSDGSANTTITLTPPGAALTGPDVAYPLYIDPTASKTRTHFAVVFSNGWHYFDDTSQDLKVGACPEGRLPECNHIGTGRSYFNFDVSAITGQPTTAHIFTADVYADEIHNSGGCTLEPVRLYSAGAISSSTVWGGPAMSHLQTVSANFSDTCSSSPPADVDFNNSNVVNQVQDWANRDITVGTFALIADDESDINDWKRFAVNPLIRITYDFPPSVPDPVNTSSDKTISCPGKPIYYSDRTPTVFGTTADYNGTADHALLWFEIWNEPATSRVRWNPTGVTTPSKIATSWTTNSSNTNSTQPLDDGNYALKAKASSASHPEIVTDWSAPSEHFTIDGTPPATAPTISSFDYPQNAWGAPQSTVGGKFTLNVNGSTGVAGFMYSFDSTAAAGLTPSDCNYNNSTKHWVSSSGGTATISPPPSLPVGYHTLSVRSFDDAHNVSAPSAAYVFYVAPNLLNEGPTLREAEDRTVEQPVGQGDPAYNGGVGYPVYTEGPWNIWSGGEQQHLVATRGTDAAPSKFKYTFTPALNADYALGIEVTSANHYGILQFELDGRVIQVNGQPVRFDGNSTSPGTHYLQLGGAYFSCADPCPTGGRQHTLTIDIVGTTASNTTYVDHGVHDNGYAAGIDYFMWTPINNLTADNFNDAMNNHGIAIDGSTAANIEPSNENRGLSRTALHNAGFDPGTTKTVDGVTFTMPSYTAGSNDNVMADGQTIPLPTAATANNIELLALSTCGATADYSAGVELTVNFAADATHPNGTTASTRLPSVPDWLKPPPAATVDRTTAATLPYIDVGTTRDTTQQATIYHLTLPVQYTDRTVTSVTLPYLGSNFTDACDTPTLHILAMTTS